MSDGQKRRAEKARRILNRNNAQEILKALRALEERRREFSTRWLWELIQNARDFPDPTRPMLIRVSVSALQISFAHTGRAYTEEEILSLIYHGSTKEDNPELLGQFGTGFLSTHLLSRKVQVRSTLIEESGDQLGFQFELDRSGKDAAEVGDAMERSMTAFEQSLVSNRIVPSQWTEYIYHLGADGEQQRDAPDNVQAQLDAVPYVLAFDQNVEELTVEFPDVRKAFKRAAPECLRDGTPVVVVSEDSRLIRLAVATDQDVSVALPLSLQENGTFEVLQTRAVPKLFIFLPLVASSEIGLPAVFHSRSFMPMEGRDGLNLVAGEGPKSDLNKDALRRAGDVLVRLAESCSTSSCSKLHRILAFQAPSENAGWLADKGWYREFEQVLLRKLAELPLVATKGSPVPASTAVFPVGDDRMQWRDVFELASPLYSDSLPDNEVVEECSNVCLGWRQILSADDALLKSCLLSTSQLLVKLRQAEDLVRLSSWLSGDIEYALDWLNRFILSVPEDRRRISFDGLLPDQTHVHVFRSLDKLARDSGVDESLKDLLEGLGDPVRERLLHMGIAGGERLLTRVEHEDTLITSAKELAKKRAADVARNLAPEFRVSCLSLFAWLARRNRWSDLKDSFPIFALGREGVETLTKTVDRGPLLIVPRLLWPASARQFWDAFPPGTVLIDDYAELLNEDQWHAASESGVVFRNLLWSATITLTNSDLESLNLLEELEGDDHSPISGQQITVGKLAVIGTESFLDAVRKNRERAIRFMLFLLEYVAIADHSWKRREQIDCECGKSHTLVPCQWLAWVRRTAWVPRRKSSDRLTTETLAGLTQNSAELAEVVTRKEAEELLELLGINVLEQALLAADEVQRPELRRRLAQLTKLAVATPGEVEKLMRDIEARQQAGERWRENQHIGRHVEDAVKATLRVLLRDTGVEVATHFVGYDLEAYVGESDITDEDVGSISVAAGTVLAKVEIKATRSSSVSMSYSQGEAATSDRHRYWLCVVQIPANEQVSSIDDKRIETLARFVPRIGEKLRPSRDDINDALKQAATAGFELRHVEDIRYQIGRDTWELYGVLVAQFVESLVTGAASTSL